MDQASALLDFWFGDLEETGIAAEDKRKRWFVPSTQFDEACRDRFAALLPLAQNGELNHWLNSAEGCLAFILLTDQLPRNIFRGSAEAFAYDPLALACARRGVEQGLDRSLASDHRSFFYMPFEHSEQLMDQHIAVGLFSHLRDESPKSIRSITGGTLRFAQQHRDIILKFGRFPHRNAVLGRTSTPAELEFIAQGDGFGQSPKQ